MSRAIQPVPSAYADGSSYAALWANERHPMKRERLMIRLLILTGFIAVFLASPLDAASPPVVETFAGTGESVRPEQPYDSPPSSQPRTKTPLGNPFGIEVRGEQIWITTIDDHCIYHGLTTGDGLKRVAGNGLIGYSGDGGPATEATFNWPHEVRCDEAGNLFVADTRNHVVRRIDGKTNVVTTFAGNGASGFDGDGDRSTAIRFNQPHSVVLDGDGGLLVADTLNHRIRRIDLETGVVETIAGTGQKSLPSDGAIAKDSALFGPRSLAVDANSIWIALREGNSIWRIDRATGTIHHIAGTGKKGYTGDGGDCKTATFNGPKGLAIAADGSLLVVDTENHVVRQIDLQQMRIETTIGGNGDGSGKLKRPHGIAVIGPMDVLVADSEQHRVVRKFRSQR